MWLHLTEHLFSFAAESACLVMPICHRVSSPLLFLFAALRCTDSYALVLQRSVFAMCERTCVLQHVALGVATQWSQVSKETVLQYHHSLLKGYIPVPT